MLEFDEYVAQVKKKFKEMEDVSEEEAAAYFAEKDAKDYLKRIYVSYTKGSAAALPSAAASCLSMMY